MYPIQTPEFKTTLKVVRRALRRAGLTLTKIEAEELAARAVEAKVFDSSVGAEFTRHLAVIEAATDVSEWGVLEFEALGK